MLTRRQTLGGVIVGGALAVAGPGLARESADAGLKVLLDALAKGGPAADRLAVLKMFPAEGLSAKARLDRDAALHAFETEAELVHRFRSGQEPARPMSSPPAPGPG